VTVGARPPLTANSSAADLARLAAASAHPALSSSSRLSSASENHVSAALQSAINNRGHPSGRDAMYLNGVPSRSSSGAVLAPQVMNGAVHHGVRTVAAPARPLEQQQQQQQHVVGRSSSSSHPSARPIAAAPASSSSSSLVNGNYLKHTTDPDVKLKRLPFYDNYGNIIRPTVLRGTSRIVEEKGVKKQMFEACYSFRLTKEQAERITLSCDKRADAKLAFPVQLQLRFCAAMTNGVQSDNYPASIQVEINKKPAPLPNIIPSNRPGVEGKRPSKPVDITAICKHTPTLGNEIIVRWTPDANGRQHVLNLDLVKRLNSETLMKRLIGRGVTSASTTRSMIRQKMASDDGDDIATCDLRVSIQCPISKTRIRKPCRATTCKHIQCFDAETFLQMNERKPTWVCPVCDQDAHFDLLNLDGYFQQVVEAANPNVAEISLSVDGTWTPLKANGKKDTSFQMPASFAFSSSSSSSPSSSKNANSTSSSSSRSTVPSSSSSSAPSTGTKRPVEAVDLTLDSDDEDDVPPPPPLKRQSVAPPTTNNNAGNGAGGNTVNGTGNGHASSSVAPRPVALTANQSVVERRASPVAASPAIEATTATTAAAALNAAAVTSHPSSSSTSSAAAGGLFGMSAYGLPPPPSELMDLRNPANLALLDFLPSNSPNNQSPRNRPNISTAASPSSSAQPAYSDADIVLLD